MSHTFDRGSLGDQPWGSVIATFGRRRWTGQLTIDADGVEHCIAFQRGWVVAATSPTRDPSDVATSAAETFAIDRGEFHSTEHIAIPVPADRRFDARDVVYRGARHLSDARLAIDLDRLGSSFVLTNRAFDQLDRFGFSNAEDRIIDALVVGSTLAELESRHRDISPRVIRTTVYALAACGDCEPPVEPVTDGPDRSSAALVRSPTSGTQYGYTNPDSLARRRVEAQLFTRIAANADSFTLLGVPFGSSLATVRAAHAEIVRLFQPRATRPHEARLLARANEALTDLTRRRFGRGSDAIPTILDHPDDDDDPTE